MVQRFGIAALLLLAAVSPAASQTGSASGSTSTPNPSFYLVNKGRTAIKTAYATPSGVSNWGRDRLADTTLGPGQSFPLRLPADGNCVYDIRVIYANGGSEERRGLNTCTVDSIAFPSGRATPSAPTAERATEDLSFVLVNRGRARLNELYLSNTDDDSWGQDRLGDDTLPAGATRLIRLPAGECVYDLRVVFANGEASEKRRLNLCGIRDLRVP